jgi:hypothetical protein
MVINIDINTAKTKYDMHHTESKSFPLAEIAEFCNTAIAIADNIKIMTKDDAVFIVENIIEYNIIHCGVQNMQLMFDSIVGYDAFVKDYPNINITVYNGEKLWIKQTTTISNDNTIDYSPDRKEMGLQVYANVAANNYDVYPMYGNKRPSEQICKKYRIGTGDKYPSTIDIARSIDIIRENGKIYVINNYVYWSTLFGGIQNQPFVAESEEKFNTLLAKSDNKIIIKEVKI